MSHAVNLFDMSEKYADVMTTDECIKTLAAIDCASDNKPEHRNQGGHIHDENVAPDTPFASPVDGGYPFDGGLAPTGVPRRRERTSFGLALPLTGAQALYGQDQITAAEWAVADINKNGGINGKKLEMIVLDTQADPQVGINAVNRLVRVEKAPVFVTGFSGVVKAVAPIANDNKVVELAVGANSPSIAQLGDYVYTTYPLADIDVTALAKYTRQGMGKKKAAVVLHQQRDRLGRRRRLSQDLHGCGRRDRRLRSLRSEGHRLHRADSEGPCRQSGNHPHPRTGRRHAAGRSRRCASSACRR